MKAKKTLWVTFLFIVSYALSQLAVYLWSRDNFFTSPMYILLPIVGFFGFLFLTPIIQEYTKLDFYVVLALFLVVCAIAQCLVVYIYAYQIYTVLNNMAIPKELGIFKQFLQSAFFPFVVSCVGGMFASKKK